MILMGSACRIQLIFLITMSAMYCVHRCYHFDTFRSIGGQKLNNILNDKINRIKKKFYLMSISDRNTGCHKM